MASAPQPGPLPEATKHPCNECPWRRDSEPGFLGPHTADEWVTFAHSGGPIGCHKTIRVDEDWSQPGLRQCAGAARFRANDGITPNREGVAIGPKDIRHVFSGCAGFVAHHEPVSTGTGLAT